MPGHDGAGRDDLRVAVAPRLVLPEVVNDLEHLILLIHYINYKNRLHRNPLIIIIQILSIKNCFLSIYLIAL